MRQGVENYSSMGHNLFLKSTYACVIVENKQQGHATLSFLKFDMRHWGPPIKGPSLLPPTLPVPRDMTSKTGQSKRPCLLALGLFEINAVCPDTHSRHTQIWWDSLQTNMSHPTRPCTQCVHTRPICRHISRMGNKSRRKHGGLRGVRECRLYRGAVRVYTLCRRLLMGI